MPKQEEELYCGKPIKTILSEEERRRELEAIKKELARLRLEAEKIQRVQDRIATQKLIKELEETSKKLILPSH